jgi:hypothetical protein
MMMDALAGIMLLTALASVLAVSASLRQRNAQHLSDQRAALTIAEQTIQSGHPPQGSAAKVAIRPQGKPIAGRQWIEVTVTLNGRRSVLCGLAPAGGLQ